MIINATILFVAALLGGVMNAVAGGGSFLTFPTLIVTGAAGFSLADGLFRPVYGLISEYIGRRRTMTYAYAGNAIFQFLTLICGLNHFGLGFAVCAIISGGLSGANFPMTAAMVADYYGETNNAVNYGSIYAWKALGGSFAGGIAALIMTGTLYGNASYNWTWGFLFGVVLAAIACVVVYRMCTAPTVEEMERAVAGSEAVAPAIPPAARPS